ncbi:flavodoxin domain-containing protein [Limosilactobacillus caccae]|uniref:flavodoxin domain-containing protein n=1 Tax=Limosilactobacillus caccae TaxID=1926284 RepID=UPI0009709268|nr:flavodoxin domain-containing protein [Limosilactobacillus caccae]
MRILILYSTIYGHNLEMSQFIKQRLLTTTTYTTIKDFDSSQLPTYDLLVLCPCTYGEGTLYPDDQDFYDQLKSLRITNLHYLLIGAGDKTFGPSCFANACSLFNYRLRKQGAQPVMPPIKYDLDDTKKMQNELPRLFEQYPLLRRANNDK